MTVKQLMNKLKKMPEDAIITIPNSDSFFNGEYKATKVEPYEDNGKHYVGIDTDYKKAIWTE